MIAATIPTAVRVSGMNKRYRLYQKPIYRLLDLFGLCPAGAEYFTEHAALKDVDLSIARGEKVAIIGRNGAGKSTLLKIITGLVRPTSGTVQVRGQVSNLLQIGSGFHPDFTGRQNVYANLAHQGITGAAAARLFEDILAFAEIEEYIDQPMKTYSTGMSSRLMFASSIIVKPDVLIVDEILGVGDAYFSHKSFERMREVCSRDGTTLLLVTHDIYSALHLCDRFIWLDRGEVKFDGDGKSAIALYESSIKEQEEQRLRQENASRLVGALRDEEKLIHVLFRSPTGFALSKPLAIEHLSVVDDESCEMALTVADGASGWHLLPEGNLGAPQTVDGRRCRVLQTHGSIYHKAEWLVTTPQLRGVAGLRVRCRYEGREPVEVRVFTNTREVVIAGILNGSPAWQSPTFTSAKGVRTELDAPKQTSYGTGLVRIVGVQFLDAEGHDIVEARHGGPLTVRIRVRVAPELRDRRVTFVLGFARQGSAYSAYVFDPSLALDATDHSVIDVALETVRLGSGQWYVNMGVGEPGLFDREMVRYFTIDSAWYHLLATRIELRVASASTFDTCGCFVAYPATISVRSDATVPELAHQDGL